MVRQPIKVTQFRSCNLCYGKIRCCAGNDPNCRPVVVPSGCTDWKSVLANIQKWESWGTTIRLITEELLPDEIVWAAAYSENNILQINANILNNSMESLRWVIGMTHTAERCGIDCIIMVYPIVPLQVKTYQVLQIVEAVSSCSHCRIMIRFANFINEGLPIYSGFIRVNGVDTPLSMIHQVKGKLWGCTDEFKEQFMAYIRFYTEANGIDLQICEVRP